MELPSPTQWSVGRYVAMVIKCPIFDAMHDLEKTRPSMIISEHEICYPYGIFKLQVNKQNTEQEKETQLDIRWPPVSIS